MSTCAYGRRDFGSAVRDEGDAVIEQVCDAIIVAARARDEEAVHALALDELAIGAQLVRPGTRRGHQQIEPRIRKTRSDGGEHAQEEGIIELAGCRRQHQSDRSGSSAAQTPGKLIRPIVYPRGLGGHPCARRRSDVRISPECAGDGRHG